MSGGEDKKKIDKFVAEQLNLLNTERLAVTKQEKRELAELGNVVQVQVDEIQPQPRYGGLKLKLKQRNANVKAPNFKVGENVALDDGDEGSDLINGILKKILLDTYEVEVSESLEVFLQTKKWDLLKMSDQASFDRMEEALEKIPHQPSPLRDVLLGLTPPSSNSARSAPILYRNKYLDDSQKSAVQFALEQKELAVIHGPPGTGKTTTLLEIIEQTVRRGEKVLVTAASHVAVDNIGEKLARDGLNILRIGHPARITSEVVLDHSLTIKIAKQIEIVEKLKYEFEHLQRKLHSGAKLDKATVRGTVPTLKKKLTKEKTRLKNMKEKRILEADVVLGTLIGCGTNLSFLDDPPRDHFQLTIIDECGQSLEMACWIVIPRSPRLILAGDHNQLPPTVITKSKEAMNDLSKSLMERVLEMFFYGFGAKMLQLIMDWSSKTFYHGLLYASPLVSGHRLSDLRHVARGRLTDAVLRMVDTAGKRLTETSCQSRTAPSFANIGEAAIVIDYVKKLTKHGVTPDQIAIISPYKAQVNILESNLREYPELEIRSVDGFQGREKEVVILSLVRSNDKQNLGFLVEKRRLNVGVTRAKRQLVLICDSSTVCHDEFLGKFISHMRDHGVVEEAPVINTRNIIHPRCDFFASDKKKKFQPQTSNMPRVSLPSLGKVVGHSSVEDAVMLYRKRREESERLLQTRGGTSKTGNISYQKSGGVGTPPVALSKNKSADDISRRMSGLSLGAPSLANKMERLKTLSPGHTFKDEDFTALLRHKYQCHYKRVKAEIEWTRIWLPIRHDRKNSRYNPDLSIKDAFNILSNVQLIFWLQNRECKVKEIEKLHRKKHMSVS